MLTFLSTIKKHYYMTKPPCFCRKMKKKNRDRFENIITLRVFGVIRSYLVCVELIIDVFRKIKNFDENFFFHDEKSQILVNNFSDFQNSLLKKNLRNFRILKNLEKLLDQDLKIFIGKNIFSSKFYFFLKHL